MKMKGGFFLLLAGLVFIGCTKEQPYETLYKENNHSKSVIDTNAEYVYVPSAVEADRQAPGGRPYDVGERKLVRFEWAEKELQLIEIDPDARFKDNTANLKIVLTIPVEHLDFRCAKDKYGECTNKEEEVTDVPFSQKPSFKPDMAGVKIKEVDLLPIEWENLFRGSCYQEKHVELIGYRLDNDGLNLQLERTYQASPDCVAINEMADLNNLSFKARFNYSVVKLSSLVTPGYQPISYPKADEGTFGFFTTEKRTLAVDNRDTVDSEEVFLNRWSPKRGEITYNLSPAFAKPENAAILKSTYKVIEKLNRGLDSANSGIHLKLAMPDGKISGDLHHSEIVMIEDPLKVGLLGYGPSITDPHTGEIIWARVAMYTGVMKQFIWREYNALIQEKRAALNKTLGATQVVLSDQLKAVAQPVATQDAEGNTPAPQAIVPNGISRAFGVYNSKPRTKVSSAKIVHGLIDGSAPSASFMGPALKAELKKEMRRLKKDNLTAKMLEYVRNRSSSTISKDDKATIKEKLASMDESTAIALLGAYPAELFNFQAAISTAQIDDITDGDLKLWEELTDSERAAIIEKVMPIIWEATLIHEIGHTLGLRHNFAGSEDKANFYSKDELAAMGIDRPVPYSSVMEYTYSDISALNTLGRYDIAALKFGYAREVELENKQVAQLGTHTIKELEASGGKLKNYSYCSDEHVDANPNCNRFDEGTSLGEIAKQLVTSSEHYYKIRNFRNGRRNFSSANDGSYISGAVDKMYDFRLFFERYLDLQERFKVPLDVWKGKSCPAKEYNPEDCEFLVDIYSSVQTGMNFMLNTITTPDNICAVAEAADPSTIVALVNQDQISKDGVDCFDLRLNPDYVVVGQTGKSFRSRKATTNENSYADQIDVRGIWGDKIAALALLLSRRLDSSLFDEDISTFIDNSDLAPQVLATLVDVITDDVTRNLEIEIPATGQKIPIQWNYSLASTHNIPEPLDTGLAAVLGLRNGITPFIYQVTSAIQANLKHPTMVVQSEKLMDAFSVGTCLTSNMGCPKTDTADIKVVAVGSKTYVANSRNEVAAIVLDQIKDITAQISKLQKNLALLPKVLPLYEAVNTKAQLNKIYALLNSPNPDLTVLTAAERAVYDLGLDMLLDFARGNLDEELITGKLKDLAVVYNTRVTALDALPHVAVSY